MKKKLTKSQKDAVDSHSVDCLIYTQERIENLSHYMAVLNSTLEDNRTYWFRGHRNIKWDLLPSALRYKKEKDRKSALQILGEFQKIAEIKLGKPIEVREKLKLSQIAQHYGLPTRLLDWTESATFALFFACQKGGADRHIDGIVYLLRPEDLSKFPKQSGYTSLDPEFGESDIADYFNNNDKEDPRKTRMNIAIKPAWNSERLMLQRGAFTLHGNKSFSIDRKQAPSLIGVPIFKEYKENILVELRRIGVDEMTIFPELEHACRHLKEVRGLT